jgi:hypothetical protein
LIVAWIVVNGRQISEDSAAFHAAKRPVVVSQLVRVARAVEAAAAPALRAGGCFRPLDQGRYPDVDAPAEALAFRSLQADYDSLAALQQRLREERRRADEAEAVGRRRQQTYDAIAAVHARAQARERAEAARAAAEWDWQVRKLGMERKRLRQNEERLVIDAWRREWDVAVDTGAVARIGCAREDAVLAEGDRKMQAMADERQRDGVVRESRRMAAGRARHARGEIESQIHGIVMRNELRGIAKNPALLLSSAPMKRVSRRQNGFDRETVWECPDLTENC